MKNIAVIPARGGSKRIPRKNIKPFKGVPMISRTIKTALESNLFQQVIVSTDDLEIAEISIEAGASVPYLRASSLSDDTTPTAPVIADVLQNEAKELYDFCCCIYPCTPLLNVDDLYLSLEHLISKHASFCYPIVEYSHPVQRSLRFGSEGFLQFVESKNELIPTQNFETLVHDAGQFYWGAVPDWTNERKMHSHNAVGYKIPSWRVVDIDTEEDWFRAELIYELLKLQQFGVTHGKL